MHSTRRRRLGALVLGVLAAVGALTLLGGSVTTAKAAFPGENGLIVFQSNRDGNEEIYSMTPDGTNRVNLTRDPSTDIEPHWSPTGDRIVFVSNRDGNNEIFTMNADGSGVTQVTRTTGVGNRWPSWTNDGRIIFHRGALPDRDVYRINPDGTGLTNLTEGPFDNAWASAAPRGPMIAFSRFTPSEGQHLFTLNTFSGVTKMVTLPSLDEFEVMANWSPNGNDLVFQRFDDEGTDLFVVHKDGTELVQLTDTDDRVESAPGFSPDGERIVFSACTNPGTASQRCGNYLMNVDGTGETDLSLVRAPFLDDFDDNYRDPIWHSLTVGSGASVAETNGRLEITLAADAAGSDIEGHYGLNCSLPGDFDMETDYSLVEWPPANGVFLSLAAFFVNAAVARQSDAFGEKYNAHSDPFFQIVPTTDLSGSLRLVRSGGTLLAYYRDPLVGWVEFLNAPAHAGSAVAGLSSRSNDAQFADQEVRVSFDNFRIGSGTLACPSWWADRSPDWQPITR